MMRMNDSLAAPIFTLLLVAGAFFWLRASGRARVNAVVKRDKATTKFFLESNTELVKTFTGKLGEHGSDPVRIYVGDKGVVVDSFGQAEPVAFDYSEISSIRAYAPGVPQLLNLDAGAVVANHVARMQVAMCVAFQIPLEHRNIDVVIGGLKEAEALELEDMLLLSIHKSA